MLPLLKKFHWSEWELSNFKTIGWREQGEVRGHEGRYAPSYSLLELLWNYLFGLNYLRNLNILLSISVHMPYENMYNTCSFSHFPSTVRLLIHSRVHARRSVHWTINSLSANHSCYSEPVIYAIFVICNILVNKHYAIYVERHVHIHTRTGAHR